MGFFKLVAALKTVVFPNASEKFIDFDVVEILAVHTTMTPPADATEEVKTR